MAFTQQNEKDGYLFFAIAFNAVPGKTYAAQVVAAYEAGMTTSQIVNEFATKPAFTDIYGSDLTNAEFAQSFVTNVTAGLVNPINAAVQAQAIADIEAALDAGLSIGDVITNVITNITNKSVADAEWGQLVQMLANKVAVAEALTEGEFALDTTDAGALQGPLALVTEDFATVADAIAKGGALKALLDSALAADKAEADYAESLGVVLTADEAVAVGGAAKEGDAVTDAGEVAALLEARLDDIVDDAGLAGSYAAYKGLSAAQKNVAIAGAKADAADAVTLAKDALTTANANVNKVATLSAKSKALDAATAAATAAVKAAGLAAVEVDNQVAKYNVGKTAATAVSETAGEFFIGAAPGTKVIELVADKFAFVAGTDAATQTALKSLLDAANAEVDAVAAATKANNAKDAAQDAVNALDVAAGGAANSGAAQDLLDTAAAAKKAVETAEKAVVDLDKALVDLTAYAAQLTQLGNLADAVKAADDKLADAGYEVSTLVALSVVSPDKDVFKVTADSTGGAVLALTAGDDSIYVGSSYKLNADLTKGDNSALEVFFKTNGANTDVYIEQKAIGSSVAGAANGSDGNIIKITLTGVTADKVSLTDGFITVAA